MGKLIYGLAFWSQGFVHPYADPYHILETGCEKMNLFGPQRIVFLDP